MVEFLVYDLGMSEGHIKCLLSTSSDIQSPFLHTEENHIDVDSSIHKHIINTLLSLSTKPEILLRFFHFILSYHTSAPQHHTSYDFSISAVTHGYRQTYTRLTHGQVYIETDEMYISNLALSVVSLALS